jgi:electron transfer flavoprotein alpha subunit
MNALILVETNDGIIKKTSFEAIAYAKAISGVSTVNVLLIGEGSDLSNAGLYGASKVIHSQTGLENTMSAAKVLLNVIDSTQSQIIISSKSAFSDAVTARAAGALKAGLVGNVVALPDTSNGFTVKRSIFTGKAFAHTQITSSIKFLSIKKSVIEAVASGTACPVETINVDLNAEKALATVTETIKASGTLSLPEADIVVSGGRGMKGPDSWQPLLDLADALGAATACSKPVSDLDWRPHHEHVGQTGVKVAPNLYIACGISGAIQHLAGVNSSKVIVVINKDPEAPFFKAADYGIVGDVFEVLPRITAAAKSL